MDLFLRLAQYFDGIGNYRHADIVDSLAGSQNRVYKKDGVYYVKAEYKYKNMLSVLGFKWNSKVKLW